MPTLNNYANLLLINLGFIAQIMFMVFFKSAMDIKENWPLYRCNPPYWVFSENISEDFTYCVQNSQVNIMGYLLQPITYLISSLSSAGLELNTNINGIRNFVSVLRNFVSTIVQNIFGVFLNLVIEFQRMIISIKDMMGKIIGIVTTMLYVLDGTNKTMVSAWQGPNGQLVRALGSCFDPETKVKLEDGRIFPMKDLPLGAVLENGSKVFSVMKIDNVNKDKTENIYKIKGGVEGQDIIVTGDHFVYCETEKKFLKVKEYEKAVKITDKKLDWFSCLITDNRRIGIGSQIFWDWEDDILNN